MENWSMNLGLLVMATFAKTTEVTARRSTVNLMENKIIFQMQNDKNWVVFFYGGWSQSLPEHSHALVSWVNRRI